MRYSLISISISGRAWMVSLLKSTEQELIVTAGEKAARWILHSRAGTLKFQLGGGGVFGKVVDILS